MTSGRDARRDRWSAAGLAVLALGYLYAARQYPLDSLAAPGPGVFPLAAGLALLVLAGCQAIATLRRHWQQEHGSGAGPRSGPGHTSGAGRGSEPTDGLGTMHGAEPRREPGDTSRRGAPLMMAILLVVYAGSVGVLGFLPASCALIVLATRLMGVPGWWRPTLLATGVTAATYLIFAVWLGVPLPSGPLG
ncbi:MAG TPA: tripartite tricarboxylate transporter TctB family protein [Methylomirabilota bacterium]|nr:tripartite tricarboxylate transporter TctB family protein [Methylomirabilota bacterium]